MTDEEIKDLLREIVEINKEKTKRKTRRKRMAMHPDILAECSSDNSQIASPKLVPHLLSQAHLPSCQVLSHHRSHGLPPQTSSPSTNTTQFSSHPMFTPSLR